MGAWAQCHVRKSRRMTSGYGETGVSTRVRRKEAEAKVVMPKEREGNTTVAWLNTEGNE